MSLLEKVKGIPLSISRKSNITAEHAEVAVAWLNGEIAHKQIAKAVGKATPPIALWLKEAHRLGLIKIK